MEVLPQILPVEDAEIAAFARKSFERQGIKIMTGAKVTKLDKKADGVTATIDDGKGGTQSLAVERVISAVGVVGNIENLGLEKLGVKTERGTILTDGFGRTNVAGIYAIGDVAGPPMLAHKAEHEGVVCVEAIKGLNPHPLDKLKIPGCTYCNPQIASVGLTEAAAKAGGPRGAASAASPSSATARRSRWARTRASPRPSSTPRPASCWARTWSAPR